MTTMNGLLSLSNLVTLLAKAQEEGQLRVLSLTYSVDTIQLNAILFDKEVGVATTSKAWLHTVCFDDATELVSEMWGSGDTETINLTDCF